MRSIYLLALLLVIALVSAQCTPSCDENASCIDGETESYCECNRGYIVDEEDNTKCLLAVCDPVCGENSTCVVAGNGQDTVCECDEGFVVDKEDPTKCVEEIICDPVCGENSTCVAPGEDDTETDNYCKCDEGFIVDKEDATKCVEEIICDPVCGENSTCVAPGEDDTETDNYCKCDEGFIADKEDATKCVPIVCDPECGENATCVVADNGQDAICECDRGYTFSEDDNTKCVPIVCDPECGENSTCVLTEDGQDTVCECDEGYTLSDDGQCTWIPVCDPECGENSKCVTSIGPDGNNVDICVCEDNFEEDDNNECTIPLCEDPCVDNASCIIDPTDGSHVCSCDTGFEEEETVDVDGNTITQCVPIGPVCPGGCGTNEECVFNSENNPICRCVANASPTNNSTCECDVGYTGENCTCSAVYAALRFSNAFPTTHTFSTFSNDVIQSIITDVTILSQDDISVHKSNANVIGHTRLYILFEIAACSANADPFNFLQLSIDEIESAWDSYVDNFASSDLATNNDISNVAGTPTALPAYNPKCVSNCNTDSDPSNFTDEETPEPIEEESDDNQKTIIIAVVCSVAGALLIILVIMIVCCCCCKKDQANPGEYQGEAFELV